MGHFVRLAIRIAAPGSEPIRHRGVEPSGAVLEATMATTRRLPLATLGWQTWSLVVIVLVIVLAAAAYVVLR